AYALLRDVLTKTNKVGIAKVVIKTRQYLAGVKALKHALVLELMHFAEELSDAEKLNVPKKAEPGKREVDMAKALVESMTADWDPQKYKDDYRDALLDVIEEKVESGGKEIEEKPKQKKPSSKVIDLVAVLQESLAKSQDGGKKKKSKKSKTARKKAA
ncbi:MAG: Ku protein, partial [Chthoniobacterales bacterium]